MSDARPDHDEKQFAVDEAAAQPRDGETLRFPGVGEAVEANEAATNNFGQGLRKRERGTVACQPVERRVLGLGHLRSRGDSFLRPRWRSPQVARRPVCLAVRRSVRRGEQRHNAIDASEGRAAPRGGNGGRVSVSTKEPQGHGHDLDERRAG
jgi:hypothetical protein